MLVIAQSSNTWQWEDKIREFSTSDVVLADRTKEATRTYEPTGSIPYWVTSWHLFRRDFNRIVKFPWDIVIADEAQEFRNYRSKTAQLIKRLNNKIKPRYTWALTGTAISNELEELYSIMRWVDKDFFPPWPTFRDRHVILNELGIISGYKNLKGLHQSLEKRMDRKTHADQKGQMPRLLPPQVHKIEATKEYKEAEKQLLSSLDDMVANLVFDDEGNLKGVPRDSKSARAFHLVREQLCSDLKLKYAMDLCERILQENPTNRVVFFSFYKDPLRRLDTAFNGRALRFTGDESTAQKRANIKRFNGGDIRILLASNAGSAGLDLNHANYVIHLDVPFSHGLLDQRNKRITRISSVHSHAVVIFLILEDSIEEFFYQVVLNKGKLAKGALEGEIDEIVIRETSLRSFIRGKDKDLPQPKKATGSNKRKVRKPKQADKTRTTRRRNSTPRRNSKT